MGIFLAFICVLAALFFYVRGMYAAFWRYAGPGERQARADYARLVRERPDAPEARLSEAEFVHDFLGRRPGFLRYLVFALLLTLVGVPMACALQLATGI